MCVKRAALCCPAWIFVCQIVQDSRHGTADEGEGGEDVREVIRSFQYRSRGNQKHSPCWISPRRRSLGCFDCWLSSEWASSGFVHGLWPCSLPEKYPNHIFYLELFSFLVKSLSASTFRCSRISLFSTCFSSFPLPNHMYNSRSKTHFVIVIIQVSPFPVPFPDSPQSTP